MRSCTSSSIICCQVPGESGELARNSDSGICCYERKVKLTKLHVGFANPESKFKQVMTGFVAARKSTQTKKKPAEENNNQILDSDVGISNHNEAHKTKLEDEISNHNEAH